jgi:non-canonical purine NTP pyrophosphatase (RdgB/HAM1 family)
MSDLTFITGNQHKADQLAAWLGISIPHQKVDLEEIQSTDLVAVVADKAKRAYQVVGKPVLVEDVALTFTALSVLPGPFVKWFEAPGIETLCRILDGYTDRSAEARTMYGVFDGTTLHTFEGSMTGTIADKPRGTYGFGFDPVFINDGQSHTRGEMDEVTYAATSYRKQALEKLKQYLQTR